MNAGVNRPLIRRGFVTAEIVAVQIEHDQSIHRRATRAHARDSQKRIGFRNPQAHMAEAIGDAFTVENMTAVDEFLLELFEFARIKTGNIGISHEDSSNQVSQSRFYGATIALSRRVSLTIGALEG